MRDLNSIRLPGTPFRNARRADRAPRGHHAAEPEDKARPATTDRKSIEMSDWNFGMQNHFGSHDQPTEQPSPAHEEQPAERPAPAEEQPTEQPSPAEEQPEKQPAAAKPRGASRRKDAERRTARRAIAAYESMRTAGDRELAVASVLLDTTGKHRLDPEHLAIAAVTTGRADRTDRLLEQAIAETDEIERLVSLAACTAEERSRMWRVLTALDRIAGSPATTDPVGTAKRLALAISELGDDDHAVLDRANQLVAAR